MTQAKPDERAWLASFTCSEFQVDIATVIKICKTWLKMSNLTFLVRFLSVFYKFFLLNAVYLGYEILLQSIMEFRSSVVKLCEKWLKMSIMTFLVHFLSVFFDFFCLM